MSAYRPSYLLLASRPPTTRPRSRTRAGTPASTSSRAQARPAIPAPTTITVTRRTVEVRGGPGGQRPGIVGHMVRRPSLRIVAILVVAAVALGAVVIGLIRAAVYTPPEP